MVLPDTANPPSNLPVPNPPTFAPAEEEVQRAQDIVHTLKQRLQIHDRAPPVYIPDTELPEWRKELDIALKYATDIDKHLPSFYIVFRDTQMIQRLIAYCAIIMRQHNAIQTNTQPPYTPTLANLKAINTYLQSSSLRISDTIARLMGGEPTPTTAN